MDENYRLARTELLIGKENIKTLRKNIYLLRVSEELVDMLQLTAASVVIRDLIESTKSSDELKSSDE